MVGAICIRLPLPLTALVKVVELERLKASVPLSVTAAVLLIEPAALPLPICKVPAVIVVAPVYASLPVSVNVDRRADLRQAAAAADHGREDRCAGARSKASVPLSPTAMVPLIQPLVVADLHVLAAIVVTLL